MENWEGKNQKSPEKISKFSFPFTPGKCINISIFASIYTFSVNFLFKFLKIDNNFCSKFFILSTKLVAEAERL